MSKANLIDEGYIQVVNLRAVRPAHWLSMGIDAGEGEAIDLALPEGADWLLVDNEHARRAARKEGVPIKSTIDILLGKRVLEVRGIGTFCWWKLKPDLTFGLILACATRPLLRLGN
ncbi:MAG TPA: hypothetical protein EYP85_04690 [Armatimonadetes bacterium]|nr:hypothetical protein [Armatimonadota bacterium]